MALFIEQSKPKDYDCGFNLDLMIAALPRIAESSERVDYAQRIVGLIGQSHPNWVSDDGESPEAWEYFFELAEYNPEDYGVFNPYKK